MSSLDVSVKAELEAAEKKLARYQKRAIPLAANRSLNRTATSVRASVAKRISRRTGLLQKEIKAATFITRSSLLTLAARITGRRRAFNLVRFVTRSKRAPGAFRKQRGVVANPWRNRRIFEGAFIIAAPRSKKAIVVARKGRKRLPIRGLYGPSVHVELGRQRVRRLMAVLARRRFVVNFRRDLEFYKSRV